MLVIITIQVNNGYRLASQLQYTSILHTIKKWVYTSRIRIRIVCETIIDPGDDID